MIFSAQSLLLHVMGGAGLRLISLATPLIFTGTEAFQECLRCFAGSSSFSRVFSRGRDPAMKVSHSRQLQHVDLPRPCAKSDQIQFHLGNKTWTYGCEMETNSRDNNDNGKSSGDFGVAMENMSSCDPFFTRGCTPFSRLNEDKSPLYRISSARVHLEGGSGLRTNSTEVLFSMDDDDGDHLCNFTIKDEGKRLDIQCDPFVAGRYLIVRFKEAFDMMVCPVEENVSISVQTESLFLPIPIKSCVFQSNGTVSCPIRGLSSFNVTDIIVDIQYDNRSRGQLLAYASSQNVTREDENCTVRRQRNGQVHLSCNSPRRSEYVLLELPQGASLAAIQVYYIDDLGAFIYLFIYLFYELLKFASSRFSCC